MCVFISLLSIYPTGIQPHQRLFFFRSTLYFQHLKEYLGFNWCSINICGMNGWMRE